MQQVLDIFQAGKLQGMARFSSNSLKMCKFHQLEGPFQGL